MISNRIPYLMEGDVAPVCIIVLGKSVLTALVDAADLPMLEARSWYVYKGGSTRYAYSPAKRGVGPRVDMHRLIMGVHRREEWVDHLDGNGLDNRRQNLRIAVGGQNQAHRIKLQARNTSGFAGVRKSAKSSRWEAFIRWEGKRHFLGAFVDKIKAAEVRKAAEVILFGAFAPQFSQGMDRLVGKYQTIADLVRGECESKGSTGIRNVQHPHLKWIVIVRGVRLGSFDRVEKAVQVRDAYEREHGVGHDHA